MIGTRDRWEGRLTTRARMRRSARRTVIAVAVLGSLVIAPGAGAATTFTVTDPTDAALASPTETTCVSTDSGNCTLRAAIQAADNISGASANGGSAAVTIALPAGTYKPTVPASSGAGGNDDPATGDLDIDKLNGAPRSLASNGPVDTGGYAVLNTPPTGTLIPVTGKWAAQPSPSAHASAAAAAQTVARPVTVGAAKGRLKRGTHARVKLSLGPAGRRLLAKRHTLTVTIITRDSGGIPIAARTVVLHAHTSHKEKHRPPARRKHSH
jgi:hypothetical protein